MADYNSNSIITYEGLEAIRKKVGMYLGGNDNGSMHHAVAEIFFNSVDEHLGGHNSEIRIFINTEKNCITVADRGRGIPTDSLVEVFTKTHSSGKFEKNEDSAYAISSGTHGIGLKGVAATGTAEVFVVREGIKVGQVFRYDFISPQTKEKTKEPNGTTITWTPDEEVFPDNTIFPKQIEELIRNTTYLTKDLTCYLKVDNLEEKVFKSKKIEDIITENLPAHERLTPIYEFEVKSAGLIINCALAWGKRGSLEKTFVNLISTPDGGTHLTALKATLTREFNKNLGKSFTGEEIRKGLHVVLSIKTALAPIFSGQNKSKFNMPELNAPISSLLKDEIRNIIVSSPKEFDAIAKLLEKINSVTDVDKLMKAITNSAKKKSSSLFDVSNKYRGCSNEKNIELFLAEGQSAAGGLLLTRNPINQAIYSLKGKPLNTLSKELSEVLKNEEIQELIRILGEPKDALKKFDRIILAADADVDGVQIINLLLGFFAKFYKELLLEGKIFLPTLPLYMASSPKGELKFLMDDVEKNKIPKTWDISYLKGLGELPPTELSRFTTDVEQRELKQILIAEEEFEDFYDALKLALGKEKQDMDARREMFI